MPKSIPRDRQTPEGVAELRGCLRDLMAASGLPTLWLGMSCQGVVDSLADALVQMVDADYLHIDCESSGVRYESVRGSRGEQRAHGDQDFEMSLGCGGTKGRLIIAVPKPAFPTEFDKVLLQVSCNLASTTLERMRIEHERERTEEARQAIEDRFTSFMRHLPGAAWIKDIEGRYVYANQYAERIFQTPLVRLRGRTDQEIFPPEIARQFQDNDRRAVESRGMQAIERLEQSDGIHDSIVSKFPICDAAGNVVYVGGIAFDITEQRQVERALRQSEQLNRATFNSTAVGICEADPDGRILRVNPEFCRITGYSEQELLQLRFQEITHPDDVELDVENFRRAAAGEIETYNIEKRYIRKDGDVIWIALSVSVVRDMEGRPQYGIGIVTDITERKQIEEALRNADRRKDEFLAMLAHELRNPLAPIRSGLDLLALGDGHQPETIQLMQAQVNHLVRLVDDLLDVSRIIRGKVELRKETVPLATIVHRSVETVRRAIEDHRQQLHLALVDEPIWLHADPVRLAQVLENLLNNASKYTDQGGRIELAVNCGDSEAIICVKDDGIGIEGDLLPQVFDLFTQSSRALDRAQGGLGIGLTLARNLIELHGGSISARSDGPGKGSEFTVRLPILRLPPQMREPQPRQTTSATRRILVVDDNCSAAEVLARLIALIGAHEVDVAHDGPSALVHVEEFKPDIVLLDIGLPGMDGLEVGRAIRRNSNLNHVVLVALTGYGQEEDRRLTKEAGFDQHLVKPIDVQTLEALLAQA